PESGHFWRAQRQHPQREPHRRQRNSRNKSSDHQRHDHIRRRRGEKLSSLMHPILSRKSYLGAYIAVWVPLACLLIFLVRASGGLTTTESVVLLGPMAVLFALAALAAWYSCRATPLRSAGVTRLFVTHLSGALILSFVWAEIGKWYARGLAATTKFHGLDA